MLSSPEMCNYPYRPSNFQALFIKLLRKGTLGKILVSWETIDTERSNLL